MIVNIAIHFPDIDPNSPEAVSVTDKVEAEVADKMNFLTALYGGRTQWWIDVVNGETRYKPENVSELS
jgi:hypothetical protein